MGRGVLWASIVITVVVTTGAQPDLRSVLTLTLAALAVALVAAMSALPAPRGRVIPVRARHEAPVAPRHCDPDADGRPQPRAPSAF